MNFKKIFIEIHFPMGTLSDSPQLSIKRQSDGDHVSIENYNYVNKKMYVSIYGYFQILCL